MSTLSMKVNLPLAYRAQLLQTPIDTPLLADLDNREETALAMRVQNLFFFRRKGSSIMIRLVGSQGKEGIWVVATAFRIVGTSTAYREGLIYVNPKQKNDYRLLQHLTRQERFPLFFFSPHLKVAIGQEARWSVQHRQEARILLAQIDHSLCGEKLHGERDPEFEYTKKEFQQLYSAATLLSSHSSSSTRGSFPLRGVVLD